MHQSPQTRAIPRRDKYGELEASSSAAERRLYRGYQPRKPKDERWN